jgi:hypothetical protein
MEPQMDADARRSELSARTVEIRKAHRTAFGGEAMNRVEFRVGVHRRVSAVSLLFSD